ncbi:MAG: endonuclease/exonuclease/phosphatase family metal-dependent hydrolase [Candidatus Latescibacterota bacterium]|jgi:endonuclease/exonuclease/phosphatase family metal-dependent hydrolase
MIQLTPSECPLTHDLEPRFNTIKSFTTLDALQTSDFYQKYGLEIERIINGVAWRNTLSAPETPKNIRVVAWNIERGLKIDGILHLLKTNPVLAKADILLITEADIGMGRTDNRNIPQELADAVGMNYVFANSFLSLEKGDIGEQNHDLPNTLSLHGICILSKFPIQSYQSVSLPMFKDVFNDIEKRLGSRKALICTIPIGHRTLDFAVIHIELATSAPQRGLQIQTLLHPLSKSTADGILIGGDCNTITYNLRSKKHLFASLFYKAFLGIHGVVRHYMTPEKHFEKPFFGALTHHRFDYNTFNDRTMGTIYYDINNPIIEAKLRQYRIPAFALRVLRWKLARYNGRVPLRLDWFAGKNLDVVAESIDGYDPPQVIDTPLWQGHPVSDHSPIVVDLEL